MDEAAPWLNQLGHDAGAMGRAVASYAPNLFAAILLLLAGWIIARLVRGAAVRLGQAANRMADRYMTASGLLHVRISPRGLQILGAVIYWLVILLFITAAARIAKLDAFSVWLSSIVAYLPTLAAGLLIVFGGYLLSVLVRDLVNSTFASTTSGQSELIGVAAQVATLLTAIVIGIDQIGIDITFLITLIAIVLSAVLVGFSIAFGLGARDHVANLIAAHELRGKLEVGQRLTVAGAEGEVSELTSTSVVLISADGRVTIPAKAFSQEIVTVVAEDHGHG